MYSHHSLSIIRYKVEAILNGVESCLSTIGYLYAFGIEGRVFQTEFLPIVLLGFRQYKDSFTDDASVVEGIGQKVTMVEGNRENIKITTPFDIKIAEALLG